jgi:sulfide dehydrogenase cytochrome subunit
MGQGAVLAATCTGCHSQAETAELSLNGWTKDALSASLNTYRIDPNGTTVMHRIARGYSEDDIEAVSAYLSSTEGHTDNATE